MGRKIKKHAPQPIDFNELQLKVRRAVECLHRDRPDLDRRDLDSELHRIAINITPNNRNDMLAVLISAPYILERDVNLWPMIDRGTTFQAQEVCRLAIAAALDQEAGDWDREIRQPQPKLELPSPGKDTYELPP